MRKHADRITPQVLITTADQIAVAICASVGVDMTDVCGERREPELVLIRYIISKHLTDYGIPYHITESLLKKSRGTVSYYLDKFDDCLPYDRTLRMLNECAVTALEQWKTTPVVDDKYAGNTRSGGVGLHTVNDPEQ